MEFLLATQVAGPSTIHVKQVTVGEIIIHFLLFFSHARSADTAVQVARPADGTADVAKVLRDLQIISKSVDLLPFCKYTDWIA